MGNDQKPLRLALYGIDSRATKTLMLFLQGPCKGAAYVVVNAEDADVDVFDVDSSVSKKLLEDLLQDNKLKPAIVFSLWDFEQEGVFHVKKPIKASDLLSVFEESKAIISGRSETDVVFKSIHTSSVVTDQPQNQIDEFEKKKLKTFVYDQDEGNKTPKYKAAMRLDQKTSRHYTGVLDGFDIDGTKQPISDACYDPKDFYQGYYQFAAATAKANNQIMLLESDWGPMTLFPRTQEIWLDASEQELKGFAAIQLNYKFKMADMNLLHVDPKTMDLSNAFDKFQSMESFLWKLACWTSKGRYPKDIDYRLPVYLKHWPNFTRLLVTPQALRISALLIREPRTMGNIAQTLNIAPQDVFVFVSAAYAVGLVEQVKRAADSLVQPPDIKPTKGYGLLGRILNKLSSNK